MYVDWKYLIVPNSFQVMQMGLLCMFLDPTCQKEVPKWNDPFYFLKLNKD